jgi:hypothetical protein
MSAARWYVEGRHASLDFPVEIMVRVDDEDGHRFEILVEAHQDVSFSAKCQREGEEVRS